MKKSLIALMIVLSAGCSETTDNFQVEEEIKVETVNIKENTFIKTCSDSAVVIERRSDMLINYLDQIDFQDTDWQEDVKTLSTNLLSATDDYTNQVSSLDEPLTNKYSESLFLYDEGIAKIREVSDIINQELDSYDKAELKKLVHLLIESDVKIELALEKLDEERDF